MENEKVISRSQQMTILNQHTTAELCPFRMTKKAFTLAEVLITLAVIGVIAAITIPSLNNNINHKQLETAYMANYSILVQATTGMFANYNGNIANVYANTNDILADFSSRLKVIKTCAGGNTLGKCWTSKAKNLDGSSTDVAADTSWYNPDVNTIVLTNGAALQISPAYYDLTCSDTGWYSNPKSSGFCAILLLDTNGLKGPNTLGRDIFYFYLVNQLGIIPDGYEGTDDSYGYYCDLANSDPLNGATCAAHIMIEQGMKY